MPRSGGVNHQNHVLAAKLINNNISFLAQAVMEMRKHLKPPKPQLRQRLPPLVHQPNFPNLLARAQDAGCRLGVAVGRRLAKWGTPTSRAAGLSGDSIPTQAFAPDGIEDRNSCYTLTDLCVVQFIVSFLLFLFHTACSQLSTTYLQNIRQNR